jgi:plastocyanin
MRRALMLIFTGVAAVCGAFVTPAAGAALTGHSSQSNPVGIVDFGYKPKDAKVAMGGEILWTNIGRTRHSATGDGNDPCCTDGPALWKSGAMDPGATFSFVFAAAGTYTYHCTEHTFMTARIKVAPSVSPPKGDAGTAFTITWAKGSVPDGFDVDVQVKTPTGAWSDWKTNQTGSQTSAKYRAKAGPGTYQFRARLQNTATAGASDWSPPASVKIA